MSKFTVVYDACVLYPAPLRDALMRLALTDLFKAHWTDHIHDEWINALLRAKKHSPESLMRARELMDRHVRDAKVYGYEPLIEGLIAQPLTWGGCAIIFLSYKETELLH